MAFDKSSRRAKIKTRIRGKVSGSTERPRLSVFRSNKAIYAQLIDDIKGSTISSASSVEIKDIKGTKLELSKAVGKKIAEDAKAKGITTITFDRGGYLFHGRVKALADGAREAGLNF